MPVQPIPYATPWGYQADQGAWREGNMLVVRKQVSLPPRCVKCNCDVDPAQRWNRTFYWAPPALALLVLLGLPGILIYIIVALCIRQKAVVEASICAVDRRRRLIFLTASWVAALVAVGLLVGGIFVAFNSRDATTGVVLIVSALAVLIVAGTLGARARVLFPKKMQGDFAYLNGAGLSYLSTFPATQ
jgi:hypothetical protein